MLGDGKSGNPVQEEGIEMSAQRRIVARTPATTFVYHRSVGRSVVRSVSRLLCNTVVSVHSDFRIYDI